MIVNKNGKQIPDMKLSNKKDKRAPKGSETTGFVLMPTDTYAYHEGILHRMFRRVDDNNKVTNQRIWMAVPEIKDIDPEALIVGES